MKHVGDRGQTIQDYLYSADGAIADGGEGAGASTLVLPRAQSRSYLILQNRSLNTMYVEIGGARATAVISGGVVTGFTVVNGGFGYLSPPKVVCIGGGTYTKNGTASMGATLPDWPSPSDAARGTAVLTGGVVTSITLDHPGAGYTQAPYVFLENHPDDAQGCADPNFAGGPFGFQLFAGGELLFQEQCPTDAVAAYTSTAADAFFCRYMF